MSMDIPQDFNSLGFLYAMLVEQLYALARNLDGQNQEYAKEIETLKARLQEVEDQLARNSNNSNSPSSSAGPEKPAPKSRRKRSGKKPGGQPNHEGSTLELSDDPDKIEIHQVETCDNCGRDLTDVEAHSHECRQEVEIPPVKPVVTEHRAEKKLCPDCQFATTAKFPGHITQTVVYGANVRAMATYQNQYQFIPYNRLQEFFKDWFQLSISQGSLVNFVKKAGKLVEPAIEVIKKNIIASDVANFDESGMRAMGKTHWLHVASTEQETYYEIHQKRGKLAMDDIGILPDFRGTAIHDHWKPYFNYNKCDHALCNAHHIRELIFLEERYEQKWATALLDLLQKMNDKVHEFKEAGKNQLDAEIIEKYEKRYDEILQAGLSEIPEMPDVVPGKRGRKKQHKAKNLLDRLQNFKKETLAFLHDFKVPFTNNLGERDIRMCKVKSKISGSFRSEAGVETFAKVRSYISTVKKQGQNVLGALLNAFKGNPFIPPAK